MTKNKTNPHQPNLSILIPCHNEESTLKTSLDNISKQLTSSEIDFEILCINNASTDETEQILKTYEQTHFFVKYLNSENKIGYGVAIRHGLQHYKGKFVIIVMADGSEEPKDIVKIYQQLEKGYDCVSGQRFLRKENVKGYPKLKLFLNRLGNQLISKIIKSDATDLTYGFKGYKREKLQDLRPLVSEGFNVNLEIFLNVHFSGALISEVETNWKERTNGTTKFKLLRECRLNLGTFLAAFYKNKIRNNQ